MRRRFLLILATGIALAAADLFAKAVWPTPLELLHQRSQVWVFVSCALLAACFASAVMSSPLATTAAALCVGGLLGNVASALRHHNRVPDPFLLGGAHGLAFNLADVFFVVGIGAFAAAALHRAWITRSQPFVGAPRGRA